ncbi:hypothetical protein QYE76_061926 [Lolium multiflorum]|uniref:DUF1677 family protein n=1 Tax=Lolium multiflorum TaxID=4521 RepID=A0AAD8S1Q6_LOLMU|nr:uncharacterized protein LOC124700557 [Lolium rigidum]KAK1644121.1 hypothetical protein QYE76_061926 [Lolium multiflorum]
MDAVESSAVVSCDCCGLEEECTGEYIGGVRAYFCGRWLCGLCSESVKYEAGRKRAGMEEAVRAHMAFCRMLRRAGPAERVAEGMCQMLRRTASGKPRAVARSSSSLRPAAAAPITGHHRASTGLSVRP